jgi:hypothetical protein
MRQYLEEDGEHEYQGKYREEMQITARADKSA